MPRLKQTEIAKLLGKPHSKYHNKISMCLLKHNHDSRAEADYCNYLLACKQNKLISDFDIQVPFLVADDIWHVVDFLVHKLPTKFPFPEEVHEVKGFATAEWKLKKKLFIAKYPDIKYVVITKQKEGESGRKNRRCKDNAGRGQFGISRDDQQ